MAIHSIGKTGYGATDLNQMGMERFMVEDKLKATITIKGTEAKVHLEGVWTRKMIDIAHNRLINALPGHLANLRINKQINGEVTQEKEK